MDINIVTLAFLFGLDKPHLLVWIENYENAKMTWVFGNCNAHAHWIFYFYSMRKWKVSCCGQIQSISYLIIKSLGHSEFLKLSTLCFIKHFSADLENKQIEA